MAALPRVTQGDPAFLECARFLVEEFGSLSGSSQPRDGPVCKIQQIDRALVAMSCTRCLDSRADPERFIIEPDLLPGETLPVQRMLRPDRCFTVYDTLAKNCILRELQRTWCPGARGTKGMTEMLDACGLGPLETARAWEVKNGDYRGPADTDPDKVQPETRNTKPKHETRTPKPKPETRNLRCTRTGLRRHRSANASPTAPSL